MSDLIQEINEEMRCGYDEGTQFHKECLHCRIIARIEELEAIREAHVDEIYELKAENEMLTAENRTLRNVGITQQETIERLRARVEVLEGALMEIRQAAEDNNLMPDYIIALTMIAATEQEGE